MTPYYQDEWVTIYHGDCRKILSSLSEVNAIITDPPYGIGFSEYESHKDVPSEYGDLLRDSIFASERLVKNGWMCVFQAAKRAREWTQMFPREWRLIACAKNFVQILPNKGPIWSVDYALIWPCGEVAQRGKGRDWHLAITSDMSTRPKGHPCPRPLDQMNFIVDSLSESGDTVLDLFMGSGTTLVAAKQLRRRAIGIEIEEKYCEIAARRCEMVQPSFFDTPIEKEVQEGMF